jgi:hypothetical protein
MSPSRPQLVSRGDRLANPRVSLGLPPRVPAGREIDKLGYGWVALEDVFGVHRNPARSIVRVAVTVDELPASRLLVIMRDEQDGPTLLHHLPRRDYETVA